MKKKNIIKKIFGKKIDIWDIILLVVMVGAVYFIIKNTTIENMLLRLSWIVLGATFITYVLKSFNKLKKKARR